MKSETRELKKFKILSVGIVFVVIGLIMGLLQGISLGVAAHQTKLASPEVVSMSFSDAEIAGNAQAIFGLLLIKMGYWSILIMPIVFAVLYFVGAVIIAWIYNLVARYVGGIKVVLD